MRVLGDELGDHPAHWMAYFGVDSVDASAATATEAGGALHVPKTPVWEQSAFAVLGDPVGAAFAVFEGRFDD
jgi:predicted enzyme related to lactoylglutathione lyase